ncbi:multidrug resistance regulator 2 [Spathaspora sp. JA1]|nr:multidrug resistance regulator 2 [Spathaspora sp. JA1]
MPSDTARRRNRAVLSCDVCRTSRTKCDRGNPCLTCVKRKKPCTYNISHEKKPTTSPPSDEALSQIMEIKRKIAELEGSFISKTRKFDQQLIPICKSGDNPIANETDEINFNYGFQLTDQRPLLVSHRPLPYLFLMRRDPGSRLVLNYLFETMNRRPQYFNMGQSFLELTDEKRADLAVKSKLVYGEGYIPTLEEAQSMPILQTKQILNYTGLNKGVVFVPDIDISDPLSSYFKLIPPPAINDEFLDIFFKQIYPFMPILDEIEFKSDLHRLLGEEVGGQYLLKAPNILSPSDLATLAIHLIVLRMAYLSLFSFTSGGSSSNILLDYPISLDAIRGASTIMKEFDLARRQPLIVLQAGLLFRIYLEWAPENFTSGSRTQISMGAIIQLAYSLGLNRDPTCFTLTSPRQTNLRRKIWHTLVRIDVLDSMIFGTTLSTDPTTYDTQLPQLEENNGNIHDKSLERDIIESFHKFEPLLTVCYKLTGMHLRVKGGHKLSELTELISELELLSEDLLGTVEQGLKARKFLDLLKLRILLFVKLYLIYNHYNLFLYYETRQNSLQMYYFRKTLDILLIELRDFPIACLETGTGYSFSLIFAGILQIYLHVVFLIIMCIRSRFISTLYEQKRETEYGRIIQSSDLALKTYSYCNLRLTRILGDRFKYSWILSKVHMNILSLYDDNVEIFNYNEPKSIKEAVIDMPISDINYVTKLTQECIDANKYGPCQFKNEPEQELIEEIQRDNLWHQLKKIMTEETVTSAWIDKSKYNNFNSTITFDFDLFVNEITNQNI